MLGRFRYALVVTLAACLIAPAQTSPDLPNTKAGQTLREWLQLCSGKDVDQFAKWGATHYSERVLQRQSAAEIAKDDANDCSSNGGFTVIELADSKPDRIDVVARSGKLDVYVHIVVGLDAQGRIESLNLRPAVAPESALPKDLSDAALNAQLSASADKLNQAGKFSGIVVVARGVQPIVSHASGYADREAKTAITPQTQFTIGSMGKMFTATAIGQLVDQKKLSYDDPVGKFFPQYGNKTIREKATIGMLLSHTAGLKDFLGKRPPEMMKNGVQRASEFMPLYENDEPRFEPGHGWAYSNAGLALVGAIVEKVSGESYPDYIRKHIFELAGMKNSDPNNVPHVSRAMVKPYTHLSPNGPPSEDWHEAIHDLGSPAGGAISTAEDLIRFADALRSGRLVSKETFATMIEPHGDTPWGGTYGYAMDIDYVYGRKVVGHGGGFPGVSTHLYMVLDSPYTVVVLANQDPPAADRVGDQARALVAEKAKRSQ